MNFTTPQGQPVHQAGDPYADNPLLDLLLREWAGRQKYRMRQLAALTLRANGWHFGEIALVLGYSSKGNVQRLFARAAVNVQSYLQSANLPRELRDHLPGFDPDSADEFPLDQELDELNPVA